MITAAAPTAPRALHREDLHDLLNRPTVATRQSSAYSPIVASTRSGITSLLGSLFRHQKGPVSGASDGECRVLVVGCTGTRREQRAHARNSGVAACCLSAYRRAGD